MTSRTVGARGSENDAWCAGALLRALLSQYPRSNGGSEELNAVSDVIPIEGMAERTTGSRGSGSSVGGTRSGLPGRGSWSSARAHSAMRS